MESLQSLKYSLTFNRSLDQIINILKIATSIQLRQLQQEKWGEDKFVKQISASFSMFEKEEIINHNLISREKAVPQGIVVVTSDEGFLGELNILLLNAAMKVKQDDKDVFVVLGEKGAQFFRGTKQSFMFLPGVKDKTYMNTALKLKKFLFNEYIKGAINRVIIVYAEFISITARHIQAKQLLPFPLDEIRGFAGKKGGDEELMIRPSHDTVVEGLVGLRIGSALTEILYSSKLSELAARLMHLEASYQELTRINNNLAREYFKSVHALADKRIRELLASRIKVNK
ncbi:MAG: FoF1 ATP synthase subunit gamma [Candidatus Omnitrophota bacterium]